MPDSPLEVLVEADGMLVAAVVEARHDPRLLIVAHPLLKEVGLASAASQSMVQRKQSLSTTESPFSRPIGTPGATGWRRNVACMWDRA